MSTKRAGNLEAARCGLWTIPDIGPTRRRGYPRNSRRRMCCYVAELPQWSATHIHLGKARRSAKWRRRAVYGLLLDRRRAASDHFRYCILVMHFREKRSNRRPEPALVSSSYVTSVRVPRSLLEFRGLRLERKPFSLLGNARYVSTIACCTWRSAATQGPPLADRG